MKPLVKQPNESRLYTFNFTHLLGEDEVISSIVSVTATPAGLTLGTPIFDAENVQVRISSGVEVTYYKLKALVTTSEGNTLEGDGNLLVEDIE